MVEAALGGHREQQPERQVGRHARAVAGLAIRAGRAAMRSNQALSAG
jgi:hypothetical protein